MEHDVLRMAQRNSNSHELILESSHFAVCCRRQQLCWWTRNTARQKDGGRCQRRSCSSWTSSPYWSETCTPSTRSWYDLSITTGKILSCHDVNIIMNNMHCSSAKLLKEELYSYRVLNKEWRKQWLDEKAVSLAAPFKEFYVCLLT